MYLLVLIRQGGPWCLLISRSPGQSAHPRPICQLKRLATFFFSPKILFLHCMFCVLFPSVREYTPSALSPASLDSRQPTFFDRSSRSSRFSGGFHMCDYIISVPHNELREFTTKAALWLIQSVPFPSPFPLSPLPSPPHLHTTA